MRSIVAKTSIANMANRLRWGMWIVWAIILIAYVAGRFGLSIGVLRAQAQASAGEDGAFMAVADLTIVLITIALFQLGRMLGAIAAGDLFSARVVGAFRAFALWLLLVAFVGIAVPIVAELLSGPGAEHRLELKLRLRDILTVGITLILFLVARLLERARAIDEEVREFV
jgi:magnesium-transporting ATPase (P-type)